MEISKIAVVLGSRKESQGLRDPVEIKSQKELSINLNQTIKESSLLKPKELNIEEEIDIPINISDSSLIKSELIDDIDNSVDIVYNTEQSILYVSSEFTSEDISECKEIIEPESGPLLLPEKQKDIYSELSELKQEMALLKTLLIQLINK